MQGWGEGTGGRVERGWGRRRAGVELLEEKDLRGVVSLRLFPKGIRPRFGVGWGKDGGERNSKYIWKNGLHLFGCDSHFGNCVFLV